VAYANPSFETADPANPGLAQSWTIAVVSFMTIAGYALAGGLERAWEDFDDGWVTGWVSTSSASSSAVYSSAIFMSPPIFESFEAGWGIDQPISLDVGATASAAYGSTLAAFDTFEVEWFSGVWSTTLGTMTPGLYGSALDAFDTFEVEWFSGAYSTTLAGSTTTALFGGPVAYEDFSPAFAPVPFTANPSTDTFTAPAHGMSNGKRVRVTSTDHLPDGLGAGNYYFVIGATTNTFQLAATSGGSAVDVTAPGAGTHTVISDGTTEWGLLLD
jgi:hypothetical protein